MSFYDEFGFYGAKITAAELAVLEGVTAGTVTASKAVVVDANKDIGDFNDVSLAGLTSSDLTASEIVISNGDKKLVSAAVATYPSLTELAYVKGVTSAIQDQIDNIDAPANVVTISATGGDFTTIQEALNDSGGVGVPQANTMFVVYPGTYADDTIAFTASNQWVVGAHNIKPSTVLLTKATNICDFGAFTGCVVKDVKMVMTLAADAQDSTVTGTGSCNFKFCHVECVASGTIGAGDGATAYTGTGIFKIVEGSIVYTNTADRGVRGKKAVLVGAGSNFTIDDVIFTVTGSGTSSSLSAVRNNLAGTVVVDKCDITVTDNESDKTYGIATIDGSGSYELNHNNMHITNTGSGNLAIGINADADGIALTYRTMYNHIEAVAGGGGGALAYSFLLADSDVTIISQFDDLIALNGVSNTGGTYTYVNSQCDGCIQASTSITGNYLTASEMLISDADKKLVSAPVATYPSLTELSYVKGLSSAAQTQINAKADVGNWTALTITTDFDDDPASSSTITMNSDQTANIKVGMPIKFVMGGSSSSPGTYYAQCTAITSNLLTIAGAPMEVDDGDLTALSYDTTRQPIQIDFFVSSTYGDGVNTALLASDMNTYFKWQGKKSYLVFYSCIQKTVDTGTEPKINVRINSADVSTNDSNNGVQLGATATWVDNSAVAINTTNYDINRGESMEIHCPVAGGTGDALDLTISCVFVEE